MDLDDEALHVWLAYKAEKREVQRKKEFQDRILRDRDEVWL
jgi:hypothetical protein